MFPAGLIVPLFLLVEFGPSEASLSTLTDPSPPTAHRQNQTDVFIMSAADTPHSRVILVIFLGIISGCESDE